MAFRVTEIAGIERGTGDGSRGGTPIALRLAISDRGRVLAMPVGGETEREQQSTTPARLARALTPLKARRSSRAGSGDGALGGGGVAQGATVERISRRKLRRWNNDRLANVPLAHHLGGESVVDGSTDAEGGGQVSMLPDHWRRPSIFSELLIPENGDIRDRFVDGSLRMRPPAAVKNRCASSGGKAYDAVQERRLRGVLIKSIESQSLLPLMEGIEGVLKTFIECDGALPPHDVVPVALRSALEAPLETLSSGGVLAFPLKNSPFFRLLVHGLAQYYGLRSKSDDVEGGLRCVFVSKPRDHNTTVCLMPSIACLPLSTFIRLHYHRQDDHRRRCGGRVLGHKEEEDSLAGVQLITV